MLQRPRRNRLTPTLRNLVQENYLQVSSLIQPLFLVPGENIKLEIKSLPGIFRFSEDLLLEEIGACMAVGVKTFLIFPAIPEELKDNAGEDKIEALGWEHTVIDLVLKKNNQIVIIILRHQLQNESHI